VNADSSRPGRCERQRERLSGQVDGELSGRDFLLLQAHLAYCPACRAFRTQLRGVAEALRASALARPSVAVRPRWAPAAARPARAVLAAGFATLGLAVGATALVEATNSPAGVGALSPAQGLPVYSTPYRLEGLPVYKKKPSAQIPTTAS
jgi:anti-sigma factor RsiW